MSGHARTSICSRVSCSLEFNSLWRQKKKLTIIFNFLYHKKKNSSISYYIYIFNRLENIAEVVELVLHKKGGEKNTFNIFNDICERKTASWGGKNFSEGIQLISNYSFKCWYCSTHNACLWHTENTHPQPWHILRCYLVVENSFNREWR